MHSVNSPLAAPPPAPARPCDQRFQVGQIGPSLRSARLLLGHLWRYLQPRAVAEDGCGCGAIVDSVPPKLYGRHGSVPGALPH